LRECLPGSVAGYIYVTAGNKDPTRLGIAVDIPGIAVHQARAQVDIHTVLPISGKTISRGIPLCIVQVPAGYIYVVS
jgi:hypothetical protein